MTSKLETLEEDFYDGPVVEVNAVRDSEGTVRIEIKVAAWMKDEEGYWCGFSPSLEDVEAWCVKARKHVLE